MNVYVQSVRLFALRNFKFPLKVDSLSTVSDICDSLEIFDEDAKQVPANSKSLDASDIFRI